MACVSRPISHYLALKESLKDTLKAPVTIVELVMHCQKNVTFANAYFVRGGFSSRVPENNGGAYRFVCVVVCTRAS